MSVDVAVYCHRWSEWQVRCLTSVAQHTRQSYQAIVVCEPGTAPQNMNRALLAGHSRHLCFLDEDVEVLQDWWLDVLLETIQRPGVGMVGCPDQKVSPSEVQNNVGKREALAVRPVVPWPWIPAHVMLIDRERVPSLWFDEQIPGRFGMSDLDACLQVRKAGMQVYRDNRTVVYHPVRDQDETRLAEDRPLIAEMKRLFPAQNQYMLEKWGDLYARAQRGEM